MTRTADSTCVSVLCVDDNPLVAGAVAEKLRGTGEFKWVGRLGSADGLRQAVSARAPSIVLLDIDMPGLDPFEALRALMADCGAGHEAGGHEDGAGRDGGGPCGPRVIVFSGHVRPELLDRAIVAGAWGYISKSDGEEALLQGIRRVAAGEFAMSPEVRSACQQDRS